MPLNEEFWFQFLETVSRLPDWPTDPLADLESDQKPRVAIGWTLRTPRVTRWPMNWYDNQLGPIDTLSKHHRWADKLYAVELESKQLG